MVRTVLSILLLTSPVLWFGKLCAGQHMPLLPIEKEGMRITLQKALEHNRIHQPLLWKNSKTDSSIEILPTRAYEGEDGRSCRDFKSLITRKGVLEEGVGKACRRQGGQWDILTNVVYNNVDESRQVSVQFVATRGFFYSARNPYYMPRGMKYRPLLDQYDYHGNGYYGGGEPIGEPRRYGYRREGTYRSFNTRNSCNCRNCCGNSGY